MAGEKLYIQPILKDVVGSIDTTMQGMETKLQDVVDGVGNLMGDPDIPGQHSNLADVVNELDAVAQTLTDGFADMTTKLQTQINSLSQLVGLTSPLNPYVLSTENDLTQNLVAKFPPGTYSRYEAESNVYFSDKKYVVGANGGAALKVHFPEIRSTGNPQITVNYNISIYEEDKTTLINKINFGSVIKPYAANVPELNATVLIPLKAGKTVYFAFSWTGSSYPLETIGTNYVELKELKYTINNVINNGILIEAGA